MGPRELFQRDEDFRSPLHFAVGIKSSTTADVVKLLFDCFFNLSTANFARDISKLEYEKRQCIGAAAQTPRTDFSHAKSSGIAGVEKTFKKVDPLQPITAWFKNECKRVLKLALIRNLVGYLCCIGIRYAVHYVL